MEQIIWQSMLNVFFLQFNNLHISFSWVRLLKAREPSTVSTGRSLPAACLEAFFNSLYILVLVLSLFAFPAITFILGDELQECVLNGIIGLAILTDVRFPQFSLALH